MTVRVLTDVRLFTGGADLTSVSNKLELAAEREEKDVTTFLPEGDADLGWKKVTGGLASGSANAEGFWAAGDAGQVDDRSFIDLGGLTGWTACPKGAAVGSPAYLLKALRGKYVAGGSVGDVNPWSASASSTWPVVRSVIMHPPGTARTSTGNGTAVQVSAVTASQYLYASLHVLSVSGTTPTLTVVVESDVDNTFGSPATQITFSSANSISGQISRVAGAITDTWYRITYTITGGSPSFLFVVSLGIA
jgi:hypothetical protein